MSRTVRNVINDLGKLRDELLFLSGQERVKIEKTYNPAIRVNVETYLTLKPEELDLALLFAQGFTSKQVAHKMAIPVRTVDGIRRRICDKMKAYNMTQVVFILAKHRIIK